ncbi:MAG TPA: hypothetical protein DCS63_09205 [Elusimicrobia bacterium]|nr:hypothetical protein [Elusimicrobiota bacterium]
MKSLYLGVIFAGLCPGLSSAGALPGFFDGPVSERALGQMMQQVPYMPAAIQAEKVWDAGAFAQGVQLALDKYARVPNAAQRRQIDEALTLLGASETGFSLCHSLSTQCTIQSLAKENIEIRVKADMVVGAAGQPLQPKYAIGNKKLVILTPAMFNGKETGAVDLAVAIAHQLSHVQDVVRTASDLEKAAIVTEEKAFLAELMVYTQFYHFDHGQVEEPLMNFMLGFWHYKEEGGPLPKDFNYKGKSYSAAEFIRAYLEPAESGMEGLINLTRSFLYPQLNQLSPQTAVEMEKRQAIERDMGLLSVEYLIWRETCGLNQTSYYNPLGNQQPPVNPPVTPPVTPQPPPGPREWTFIGGGTFMMGTNELIDGFEGPKPVRQVSIKAFEMSRTDVTVAQYAECVTKGKCALPGAGGNCNWGVPGRQDHPVNCVTWDQANQFAKFKGARLPSESEWEYAARGGGQTQKYPWGGEAPVDSLLVMNTAATMPVCSKPAGNTAQGLCDMAGNVRQWVQDKYQNSYAGAPTDGSAFNGESNYWVMRGGCFSSASYAQDDNYSRSLGFNSVCVGFRLAR